MNEQAFPAQPAAEPAATEVTVAQLDQLIVDIHTKKKEIEAQEAVLTGLNKQKMSLEAKCVQYLKALDRENYSHPLLNIRIVKKWSVGMPQTDADKEALFNWMRERGIFEKYATVHSGSLNSLYMAEWEAAKRAGTGLEFTLPGIGERKLFEGLGTIKGRGKADE